MQIQKKRWPALLSGIILLTAASGALAFGGPHSRDGCHGGQLAAVYRLPDLTPAQRQQIDALRNQHKESLRGNFKAMQETRKALREATDAGDMDKVRTLANQQGSQVAAMTVARAELRQQINAVLTDTQRKELQSMATQRPHCRR